MKKNDQRKMNMIKKITENKRKNLKLMFVIHFIDLNDFLFFMKFKSYQISKLKAYVAWLI